MRELSAVIVLLNGVLLVDIWLIICILVGISDDAVDVIVVVVERAKLLETIMAETLFVDADTTKVERILFVVKWTAFVDIFPSAKVADECDEVEIIDVVISTDEFVVNVADVVLPVYAMAEDLLLNAVVPILIEDNRVERSVELGKWNENSIELCCDDVEGFDAFEVIVIDVVNDAADIDHAVVWSRCVELLAERERPISTRCQIFRTFQMLSQKANVLQRDT